MREESQEARRMMKRLSYMYEASLTEYVGTGDHKKRLCGDRDEKFLAIFFCVIIFHARKK